MRFHCWPESGIAVNIDWKHERSGPGDLALPGFPQTQWCFHPSAALARLSQFGNVFGNGTDCELIDVNWHPAKRLDISYRIGERVFAVRFLRPAESAKAHAKALRVANNPSSVVHLEDISAVIWTFPEDPDLASLGLMAQGHLMPGFQPAEPAAADGYAVKGTVLSYRKGNRCTMAFQRPNGPYTVIGKTHADAAVAHGRIADLESKRRSGFLIPAPIACDAQARIRWESFMPGKRFGQEAGGDTADAMLRLAQGLSALHQTPVHGLPVQSAVHVLQRMESVALKRIGDAAPAALPQCVDILGVLKSRMPPEPPQMATLHGDLHVGNVIFDEGTPVFIDLDGLAAGDPAFDLAMLASRLLLLAALDAGKAAEYIELAAMLPALYERAGGLPLEERTYAWYLAAFLVARQVKTAINHVAPGLQHLTTKLVRAAAAVAESGTVSAAEMMRLLTNETPAPLAMTSP